MSRNVCHVLTHMLAQLLVIFSCELVALQRHGASAHPNTHTPLPPAVVFQHMASFWQTSLHCEQAMNQQTGILPSCLLVMQVAKWTECLDPCTPVTYASKNCITWWYGFLLLLKALQHQSLHSSANVEIRCPMTGLVNRPWG